MQRLNLTQTVSNSFEGKTLLLTGATGFVAKVFLEKAIRTTPGIKKIHLLIRDGKLRAEGRAEIDIFSSRIFERLKSEMGPRFTDFVNEKVVVACGDTSLRRLGMSDDTYLRLLNEVDLVVNAAASTDFMNQIDHAVKTNTLSIANLTEFASLSGKARVLHVSTCYVNENKCGLISEDFHGPKRIGSVASFLKKLEKKALSATSRGGNLSLVGYRQARAHGWYNIYTLTKWMGERLLKEKSSQIFATILRPSIIESCLQEPVPGWIEGWKVGDPIIATVGKNKLSFVPADKSAVMDFVPVDIVSNAMFVAIHELVNRESRGVNVYQVSAGSENPVTVRDLQKILPGSFYPGKQPRQVRILPPWIWRAGEAVIRLTRLDRVLGQKFERLSETMRIYGPYLKLRAVFDNSKLVDLHSRLQPEDQICYPVSVKNVNWRDYFLRVHIPGLKRFVIQEGIRAQGFTSLRKAR